MKKHILLAAVLSGLALSSLAQAATGEFDKTHPRRAEVNHRLARQDQIRQEERDMASQNGGHITKSEQRTLNQQENAVSQQIGK